MVVYLDTVAVPEEGTDAFHGGFTTTYCKQVTVGYVLEHEGNVMVEYRQWDVEAEIANIFSMCITKLVPKGERNFGMSITGIPHSPPDGTNFVWTDLSMMHSDNGIIDPVMWDTMALTNEERYGPVVWATCNKDGTITLGKTEIREQMVIVGLSRKQHVAACIVNPRSGMDTTIVLVDTSTGKKRATIPNQRGSRYQGVHEISSQLN
jgi:hypothetical protein